MGQGMIPAMISAAASIGISRMIEKANAGKGVATETSSNNTADKALVVKLSDAPQVYGRGPESCSYWEGLAQQADDRISASRFESTEYVCRIAKTPPGFPSNWDRWVRACLQDFHELFSKSFSISRYTYTQMEFFIGHEGCFTAGFTFDFTNPPSGLIR
jgi:hypothetical protein